MPHAPEKRKRKPSRVIASPTPIGDLSLTPLQMLGLILKIVLKDRITNDEVDKICSTYYRAILKWFPWSP